MKTIYWQDTDIRIECIEGALYALYGWNGEKWLHCWKCIDRFTADPDGKEYEVRPIFEQVGEDEDDIDIVGYEIA